LSVVVDEITADVAVHFGADLRLEIVNSSAGYESWQAYFRHADADLTIIGSAQGLSYVSSPIGSNSRTVMAWPLPSG
jgi:nucleotide-binding universal stress UspA family protein